MQYIFVDSNLFLQCRPLEDLDWERLAGKEDVTLLVPSAVLTELDKHKSDGNSRRAQRARRAIKILDTLLEAVDDTIVIRTTPIRVIAQFAPEVSGDASSSNDDSILFEVAEMTRKCRGQDVSLVTHDTNLKVKAKRKSLRFFPVPDEWLLAPEPDEREKRMKRMEEEIAILKKQAPTIQITLDGNQEIVLVVPNYEPLPLATIDCLMEAMTSKFPKKKDPFLNPSAELRQLATGYLGTFPVYPPTAGEISKYEDEEYPEWEKSLRKGLERLHLKLRFRDAFADVHLQVANNGTVPCEHVHISINVSEGFLNMDPAYHDQHVKGLLALPRVPSPPQPRQTSVFGRFSDMHEPRTYTPPYSPQIHRDRDEFYQKEGGDIDKKWIWACENMRHGTHPQVFHFRVGLNAQSKPSGGQMKIEVSAENLPQAACKNFGIEVVNTPADTESAAIKWLGLNNH